MLSVIARSSSRHLPPRTLTLRSFSSSVVTRQATPTENKPLNKEFKIYRWVPLLYFLRFPSPLRSLLSFQNPDEPQKKPELQSYTVNLNECGPMVSTLSCLTPTCLE